MDITEQYKDLTVKMSKELPLKALPIRELVQIFRKNEHPITLNTEITITSVYNSGDISGIMCTIKLNDEYIMACSLSHLIFSKTEKLYTEISEYQQKRAKRIKKLNSMG
jgi:hypothetical protein